VFLQQQEQEQDSELIESNAFDAMGSMGKVAIQSVSAWTLTAQMASAAGPDWGTYSYKEH
jgi:hypothetical protein